MDLSDFQQWLSLIGEDPEFDIEIDRLGWRARKELENFYLECGLIHGTALRQRLVALRFTHAQQAIQVVLPDLPESTQWQVPPAASLEDSFHYPGNLGVVVHGREVFGISFIDTLIEVATNIQSDYIEEFWLVWPSCAKHKLALTPVEHKSVAAWLCNSGDHVVAQVGQLPH
jgi:hypothetical protein